MRLFKFLFAFLFVHLTFGQNNDVFIDQNGVMRWGKTKAEVHGFGVNYTVPFAHAYRSAKKKGVNPKEVILNDVYHFKRLGFDLYRVHVWDTQISDEMGNLIENEYLETFDFLLKTLKDHGMNYVITPIAFWGDGWPEPDSDTPGFSNKYGKGDCLTNPEAIKAQETYLFQFLNHVNPYTGVVYKDEPNLIAFEVSNEPHHRGSEQEVTAFVSKMVKAMRNTGTKKPIFYNMSHAVHFMDGYFEGGAQGGTFQWYPTGLGYGKELGGNLLPNVNDYNMPFDSVIKKHHGAKLVYEFDAADVGRSYIYPAMARGFREAGIQIATHFSYDPTFLAYANTEYNTHYMNLNYTPQKALALKICSEVFHEVPMYANFGMYPGNKTFSDFKVSYEKDLAEYNTNEKFFYTNSTSSRPKKLKKLKEIAGFGNSEVVKYEGLGAYFLDKLDDGVWRLEVQPDAVWVANPFGRNSLDKTVGVIQWETRAMSLFLPDLGSEFSIEAIDDGNSYSASAVEQSFSIQPGTYIVSKKGVEKSWDHSTDFKSYPINHFYAPQSNVERAYLKHDPLEEASDSGDLNLKVQYIAPKKPKQIKLMGFTPKGRLNLDFNEVAPYQYEVVIPKGQLAHGYLNYYLVVDSGTETMTYPAESKKQPTAWDFYQRESYKTKIVSSSFAVHLFDANRDSEELVIPWRKGLQLVPTENFNESAYQIRLEHIFVPDEENRNAAPIYDYSFKQVVIKSLEERKADLDSKKTLIFRGQSLDGKTGKLQIALVMKDGSAFGGLIDLEPEVKDYELPLANLKPVKTVTLPRPYPSFLPYYFEHQNQTSFNIHSVESVQFSIGPGMEESELQKPQGISVIGVFLK